MITARMPRAVPTEQEVTAARAALAGLGSRDHAAWHVLGRLEVILDVLADPAVSDAEAADSYRRARAFLLAFNTPDLTVAEAGGER